MEASPIQHRLKLSQLRLLVHVADTGSLLAAAERMHITQPAATKALKQLEADLGSPLVMRSSTGSVLTPLGELLCKRARLILSELRSVEEELGLFHAGQAGQITVGALPVAAPTLLPMALQALYRDHPRITVRVVEGSSDVLFPGLKEGQLDLLVGRFWSVEEPDLFNEILFESRFAVAVRPGHPLLSRRRLQLADTLELPWILPAPGVHTRSAIEEMFRHHGLAMPPHPVETTSYLVTRALVMSTDMVCPLPIEMLRGDLDLGAIKLLPLKLDIRLPPVGIVRNVRRGMSAAVETFLPYLRAVGQASLQAT